jgi:hypothetical protein
VAGESFSAVASDEATAYEHCVAKCANSSANSLIWTLHCENVNEVIALTAARGSWLSSLFSHKPSSNWNQNHALHARTSRSLPSLLSNGGLASFTAEVNDAWSVTPVIPTCHNGMVLMPRNNRMCSTYTAHELVLRQTSPNVRSVQTQGKLGLN